MTTLDMAKAYIVGGGIASLSAATCRRKGLVRGFLRRALLHARSWRDLNVTSARAQDARQAGTMGGSMVGQAGEWMLGY